MEALRIIDPNTQGTYSWTEADLLRWQMTAASGSLDSRGRPTTVAVNVDTYWYMNAGPGIYFNPARFAGVHLVLKSSPAELGLAEGQTRSLDELLSAGIISRGGLNASVDHYRTDVSSETAPMRQSIWGGTGARIEGTIKNVSGNIVLEQYRIAPVHDNYNHHLDDWGNPIKTFKNALTQLSSLWSGDLSRGVPLHFDKNSLQFNSNVYTAIDLQRDVERNVAITSTSQAAGISQAAYAYIMREWSKVAPNHELMPEFYDPSFPLFARPRCFPAGTPILMADGTERPIEAVRVGDRVAAFDEFADGGRGPLKAGRVTRLFENVTDHFLIAEPSAPGAAMAARDGLADAGAAVSGVAKTGVAMTGVAMTGVGKTGVAMTGGHGVIGADGLWRTAREAATAGVPLLDAAGGPVPVTWRRVDYSLKTAERFEQASRRRSQGRRPPSPLRSDRRRGADVWAGTRATTGLRNVRRA